MSNLIHQLPDSIANQIAAGEVIQRPASAVKELMENAIDAGASSIKLIVKDAGRSLIQVIDNGCGMTTEDAKMSFERHATSKIKSAQDLFAIRTMGFRGEALASIGAIAQVELKTKKVEDEAGYLVKMEASKIVEEGICQCQDGTSIAVRNLFFNVPARRNFLKSNTVELKRIIEEFQRIAIAHPEIAFQLYNNDAELFHLAEGNLRQRVVAVFGNSYNERLVPIEESTSICVINGYIGKPESAKKTRGEQYLFVNRRFIKSNYLNHAIRSAYEELIPKENYPLYVLFLEIDPAAIDINVHPTKNEIKFEHERAVYTFVNASARRALAKFSVTPTLDFNQETSFDTASGFGALGVSQKGRVEQPSNFGGGGLINPVRPERKQGLNDWEKLYTDNPSDGLSKSVTVQSDWKDQLHKNQNDDLPFTEQLPYQIHKQYVIAPIKSGFLLIDQQVAHQRILFERYQELMNEQQAASQQQLFPKTITVSTVEYEILKDLLDDINKLGYDIQDFGKNTFVVHGIPADLSSGNEELAIQQLLEQFKDNTKALQLNKREELAKSLSVSNGIKRHRQLSVQEMKTLIDELFACESPYAGPNGQPTCISFNLEDLAKQFMK